MTLQEAEVIAAKISLVFKPLDASWDYGPTGFGMDGYIGEEDGLFFSVKILEGNMWCKLSKNLWCHLSFDEKGHSAETGFFDDIQAHRQFYEDNTDWFRRCAYLIGQYIDCSAHEQMEWTLWLQEQELVA